MNSEKLWHVYIAESIRTKHYYVGISNDPEKRILTHNRGRGSKFVLDQGLIQLVYVSPPMESKSVARKREVQIKKWRREKKNWLIDGKIE